MIEKSRLEELEQSITGKQKEMEEVKAKRAAAAGNPAEMVILDKRITELQKTLAALERTKQAVTYMPPAPTDGQEIVSRLDKYLDAKREKVQKVQDSLLQTQREIRETEGFLALATETGDIDGTVTNSKKLDELKERLKYVQQMKERRGRCGHSRTGPLGKSGKRYTKKSMRTGTLCCRGSGCWPMNTGAPVMSLWP